MRHPDEGTIHAWLDGALDDADTAWIAAHTRECPACGALVAEARGLVAGASRVLGALDAVPGGVLPARHEPVGSGDAMAGRMMRRFAGRAGAERSARWMAPLRAAAALLLVAGGSMFVMYSANMPATMERTAAIPGDTESAVAVPATSPAVAEVARATANFAAADSAAASAPSATVDAARVSAADIAPPQSAAVDARRPAVAASSRDASQPFTSSRQLAVAGAAAPQSAAPAPARDEHNDRRVERRLLDVAEAVIGRSARQRPIEAPLVLRPVPDSLAVPATEVVVTGTVRDERTGDPVAGASILLDNGDIGTITDHLGRFTITGTTTGVHRAQVRRMGYASAEREVSVVGDSAVLDVRLAPAGTSIAAVLGEGYTDVKRPAEKAKSDEATRRGDAVRQPRPGARTESAAGAAGAERTLTDSARAPAAPPSATTTLPFTAEAEERGRTPVPLATRVPVTAMRRRSTQRDAAGSCLSIALAPVGAADAARTITVRLLPTVSGDTSLEGKFAIEFPRGSDIPEGARGSWSTVPRANEDERSATGVLLHWTAGDEEVRVSLDWARTEPSGRASVRRGGVGVDALATATRLECRTMKPAP